jgi:hypothetical protein
MSILRHTIYIVGLSIFWGDSFIIHYHEKKGSEHLREYGYYLIYTKELVRDFCYVIRVLLSKR